MVGVPSFEVVEAERNRRLAAAPSRWCRSAADAGVPSLHPLNLCATPPPGATVRRTTLERDSASVPLIRTCNGTSTPLVGILGSEADVVPQGIRPRHSRYAPCGMTVRSVTSNELRSVVRNRWVTARKVDETGPPIL